MSPLLKNLLIALGVVLVAGGVYYFMTPDDVPLDESGIQVESDAVRQTAQIRADTEKIGEFDVDGDILKDTRFRALKENQVDLVDTGTGRPNPFEKVQ